MDVGEEATLLAVALDGEETYWLCQPVGGKRLSPEWKSCTCHWLYLFPDSNAYRNKPWYREDLGHVLEIDFSERSRIERYSVIDDAVKAKKFVVAEGNDTRTFFFLENSEREVLDAKFEDLLRREAAVASTKQVANEDQGKAKVMSEKSADGRSSAFSSDSDEANGGIVGNNEAFSWRERYIVECGNRVVYVCPDVSGGTAGFGVERSTQNGITVYLLFHSETASAYKIGEVQTAKKVYHASLVTGDEGKVLVMMAREGDYFHRKKKNNTESYSSESLPKTHKKEMTKVEATQNYPLKSIGVNVWMDFEEKVESSTNMTSAFPFLGEVGASVRTAVFPGSVCVTYDSATAAKCGPRKKGVSSPTDVDMAGLLENIQLAKEQFSTI
uniref:Uncharacterized protein TCIL3000_11_14190 n=1 Tax=Trypanosoma congolense (strain IL3000) TaxID=1068625 RepID=G0V2N2_TRYCI|nr:unnamed protein product [Trypanosoma congolense IL3000]